MSLNGVAARIGPAGTGHDDRLAKDRGDSSERAEEERERREGILREEFRELVEDKLKGAGVSAT